MTKHLFVGGPWHGQWRSEDIPPHQHQWRAEVSDPAASWSPLDSGVRTVTYERRGVRHLRMDMPGGR